MDIPPSKARKNVKPRANTNRVIISVYAESPRKRIQLKHGPTTKKTTRTRGYDRRAQLLAYASELRCAGSEPTEWSRWNSRPNSKKWKWSSAPARIRESFLRMFQQKERQWGYQRIVTEENGEAEKLSGPKRINSRNQTGVHESRSSNFCKKLMCMLKELTCGLQCNKGLREIKGILVHALVEILSNIRLMIEAHDRIVMDWEEISRLQGHEPMNEVQSAKVSGFAFGPLYTNMEHRNTIFELFKALLVSKS